MGRRDAPGWREGFALRVIDSRRRNEQSRMTIYGETGERIVSKLFRASKNRDGSIDRSRTGPVKSAFLVTFTGGCFVAAAFSRNETHRSGNWIPLS